MLISSFRTDETEVPANRVFVEAVNVWHGSADALPHDGASAPANAYRLRLGSRAAAPTSNGPR
jgi:hypothetical protein